MWKIRVLREMWTEKTGSRGFTGNQGHHQDWARSRVWLPENVSEAEVESGGLTGQEISWQHSVQTVAWLPPAAPSQS